MGHDWNWARAEPRAVERVKQKLAGYRPTVLARRLAFEARHPKIEIWQDGLWHAAIPGEDIRTYAHQARMLVDELEERFPEEEGYPE